jgi:hypothetical protein
MGPDRWALFPESSGVRIWRFPAVYGIGIAFACADARAVTRQGAKWKLYGKEL